MAKPSDLTPKKIEDLPASLQDIAWASIALILWFAITGAFPNVLRTVTPRVKKVGNEIKVALTVVPTDIEDLACSMDGDIAGARCAFDRQGQPTGAESMVMAPFMTTDDKLFLVADLWDEPAIKEHIAKESALVTSGKVRRFTVRCQLKIIGEAQNFFVRWQRTADWGKREEAWVGTVKDCTIG